MKNEQKTEKKTISKERLVQMISQENEIHPNDVRQVIQSFLDSVTEHLSEGFRLEFRDFGVFEIVERKQKKGRNPKKPEQESIIPPKRVAKWTPGKKIRQLIKGTPQ
jgi:integration host factor subunit beta